MKIKVEYSAFLRHHCQLETEELDLQNSCSMQQLIGMLVDRLGEPFRSTVLDRSGMLRPSLILSVNERQVDWENPLELHDGDSVALLTPIAGG